MEVELDDLPSSQLAVLIYSSDEFLRKVYVPENIPKKKPSVRLILVFLLLVFITSGQGGIVIGGIYIYQGTHIQGIYRPTNRT